jgi:hypothetical protein
MTPVAGRISDGKKNGLVAGFGQGKGFLSPGIPVHGVMGMLLEIRTFFVSETVHLSGRPFFF